MKKPTIPPKTKSKRTPSQLASSFRRVAAKHNPSAPANPPPPMRTDTTAPKPPLTTDPAAPSANTQTISPAASPDHHAAVHPPTAPPMQTPAAAATSVPSDATPAAQSSSMPAAISHPAETHPSQAAVPSPTAPAALDLPIRTKRLAFKSVHPGPLRLTSAPHTAATHSPVTSNPAAPPSPPAATTPPIHAAASPTIISPPTAATPPTRAASPNIDEELLAARLQQMKREKGKAPACLYKEEDPAYLCF